MGGDGRQAPNVIKDPRELAILQGSSLGQVDPRLRNIMSSYGQGGMSLQDALSQAKGVGTSELPGLQSAYAQKQAQSREQAQALAQNPGLKPEQYEKATGKKWVDWSELQGLEKQMGDVQSRADSMSADFSDQLALDPLTATKFATEQVQNNPILGQLFGKDGTMSRTAGEEQRLSEQGFKLTPEDREAYGQISGDIARQFGQEEQGLAESLAQRGLASAPSGVAGQAYSGLAGNKMERLAKAQMDIADRRMQNTLQRLGQTRQFLGQLGSQGASAIQDQFGRSLAGRQQKVGERMGSIGAQQKQQQMEQDQLNTGFQQQESTRGPGLGEILGGIGGGILGGVTGGLGTAIGGGMGQSLFGAKPAKFNTQTGKLINQYDPQTGQKVT